MKNYFKLFTLVICISIFSCSKSDDSGDNGGGGGGLEPQATYRITFVTNFTETTHPTDYPDNASFGRVFLAAHSPGTSIFTLMSHPYSVSVLTAGKRAVSGLPGVQEHQFLLWEVLLQMV